MNQRDSNISLGTQKAVKSKQLLGCALMRRLVIVSLSSCNWLIRQTHQYLRHSAAPKPADCRTNTARTSGEPRIHKDIQQRKLEAVICVGALPVPAFVTKRNKEVYLFYQQSSAFLLMAPHSTQSIIGLHSGVVMVTPFTQALHRAGESEELLLQTQNCFRVC